MKIERKFKNVKEAVKSLASNSAVDVANNLNVDYEVYEKYADSDDFVITIKPTGIMEDTDGYPTNEVMLTIEFN